MSRALRGRSFGASLLAVAETPPEPSDNTDLPVAKTAPAPESIGRVAVAATVTFWEAQARATEAHWYGSSQRIRRTAEGRYEPLHVAPVGWQPATCAGPQVGTIQAREPR